MVGGIPVHLIDAGYPMVSDVAGRTIVIFPGAGKPMQAPLLESAVCQCNHRHHGDYAQHQQEKIYRDQKLVFHKFNYLGSVFVFVTGQPPQQATLRRPRQVRL